MTSTRCECEKIMILENQNVKQVYIFGPAAILHFHHLLRHSLRHRVHSSSSLNKNHLAALLTSPPSENTKKKKKKKNLHHHPQLCNGMFICRPIIIIIIAIKLQFFSLKERNSLRANNNDGQVNVLLTTFISTRSNFGHGIKTK